MTATEFPAATDVPLNVIAPRAPRHLVARAKLRGERAPWRRHRVVAVEAPAGFGKTSLLGLWRRDLLAEGCVVAWVTAEAEDDPARFVQALTLAVRHASGLPTFGRFLLDSSDAGSARHVTAWLSEVAAAAIDIALVIDEAEKLPEAACERMRYVLYNAPGNLRCIVATRPGMDLQLAELVAYGECALIGTEDLRFREEESLELLQRQFRSGVPRERAVQLHEIAEGWPLGLQLMTSAMDAGGLGADASTLDLHGGGLIEPFVAFMLDKLAPPDLEFLTRTSFLPNLHPDLVAAVLDDPDARERMARLMRDTPVFVASERTQWARLHALAKDSLTRRFRQLPREEARALRRRASRWFEREGSLELAAEHAFAAGELERAYALAERGVYESQGMLGRQRAVLEWVARLSPAELLARPLLALAAGWALATSVRHAEAVPLVAALRERYPGRELLQFECDLILGGAAMYADDPDRLARLHDRWDDHLPAAVSPGLVQVFANRSAYRAMLEGQPGLARVRLRDAPRVSPHLQRWGTLTAAVTYLWEGQVMLAIDVLRPLLDTLEADHGPRHPFTAMAAAVLASAMQQGGGLREAEQLLAHRLDVLEQNGLPDTILHGLGALARAAHAKGSDSRAFELLVGLDAAGVRRGLPRLRIAALYEQVRLHAHAFRAGEALATNAQLQAVVEQHADGRPLWAHSVEPLRLLGRAYVEVAQRNWQEVIDVLRATAPALQGSHRSWYSIKILLLRALATHELGGDSEGLLREAVDLAKWRGLHSIFFDAHPATLDLVRHTLGASALPPPLGDASRAPAAVAPPASVPTALTSREREVAELLARQLSTREIAEAMQLGPETVKWHVKNLFAKLQAASRKQAVARARLLGLLAQA